MARPDLPPRASSMSKELMTRLRPLPFQYVWSVWYSKPGEEHVLKLLAEEVPDIGAFYRIFNNFPWNNIKLRAGAHFFRAGVKPLWEDDENVNGGCWTMKIGREGGIALRVWEEMCLMTCGGELQAELASENDHVLGVSYSPRLYSAHISVWTKKGQNQKSIDLLQQTILTRLSPDLLLNSRPEYYYKRHAEHVAFNPPVSKPGIAVS